jgi:hypothetical protein
MNRAPNRSIPSLLDIDTSKSAKRRVRERLGTMAKRSRAPTDCGDYGDLAGNDNSNGNYEHHKKQRSESNPRDYYEEYERNGTSSSNAQQQNQHRIKTLHEKLMQKNALESRKVSNQSELLLKLKLMLRNGAMQKIDGYLPYQVPVNDVVTEYVTDGFLIFRCKLCRYHFTESELDFHVTKSINHISLLRLFNKLTQDKKHHEKLVIFKGKSSLIDN